jgi:prolyl oligopeptidase
LNYQKISLPVKRGEHYYFSYNEGLEDLGKTYRIDKPGEYKINSKNPTEGASVFFDPKTMLSADGKTTKGDSSWTDDYKMVAMTIQHAGSDWGTIKVMDADTRKFHEKDVLEWTKHTQITWTLDGKGFFYQAYDPPKSVKGGKQDNHAG